MAEVALVASIFGVVSFGVDIVKTLYETADTMSHAQQQINSIAKHVSQYTVTLRHLGTVIESEQGNLPNELLHDIGQLKRSSNATLKEISKTVTSKRSRPIASIKWLFKKSKAQELEARLDSQQSTLQVMIQTITVSKLGNMRSRSKEESDQLTSYLTENIDSLKTLIIENHNNVTALQCAEHKAKTECHHCASSQKGRHQERSPSSRLKEPLLLGATGDFHESRDQGIIGPKQAKNEFDEAETKLPGGSGVTDAVPFSIVQRKPADYVPRCSGAHRASTLLLQLVPYRSKEDFGDFKESNQLTSAEPNGHTKVDGRPSSTIEEASQNVRLLLDKWTIMGSESIFEKLVDSSRDRPSKDGARNRLPHKEPSYERLRPSAQDQSSTSGSCEIKDIWDTYNPNLPPIDYIGEDILNALRRKNGGIMYSKRSDFHHIYFVDGLQYYQITLVPLSLPGLHGSRLLFTEIGKLWVHKEALSLLDYPYRESEGGFLTIMQDLEFTEIENLVRLSYQAVFRSMVRRSKALIQEHDWHDRVSELRQKQPSIRHMGSAESSRPASMVHRHRSKPYERKLRDPKIRDRTGSPTFEFVEYNKSSQREPQLTESVAYMNKREHRSKGDLADFESDESDQVETEWTTAESSPSYSHHAPDPRRHPQMAADVLKSRSKKDSESHSDTARIAKKRVKRLKWIRNGDDDTASERSDSSDSGSEHDLYE